MHFYYKAIDSDSNTHQGTLFARDKVELSEVLRRHDLQLISHSKVRLPWLTRRIPATYFIEFFRHFAYLLNANDKLFNILSTLAIQIKHRRLQFIIAQIMHFVNQGELLAASLSHFHGTFDKILIALVHCGEQSNNLRYSFQQIIKYLEWRTSSVESLRQKLAYPAACFAVMILMLTIYNYTLIPQIHSLTQDLSIETNFATELVLWISNPIYILAFFCLILAVFLGAKALRLNASFAYYWDFLRYKWPGGFGKIFHERDIVLFSYTLHLALEGGMSLIDSLNLASTTNNNHFFQQTIHHIIQDLISGKSLRQCTKLGRIFPAMMVQALRISETNNNIALSAKEMSDFYQQRLDYDIKKLLNLIQPILLIFFTCFILLVILGLFLPLYYSKDLF